MFLTARKHCKERVVDSQQNTELNPVMMGGKYGNCMMLDRDITSARIRYFRKIVAEVFGWKLY